MRVKFGLFCCLSAFSAGSVLGVGADYLSSFDLCWKQVPRAYEESAFLGNGELGTCIWSAGDEPLHFDIGDTRVYSEKSRAPIGKFILRTEGRPSGFSMRQELASAEAVGRLETDNGSVAFRSLASVKYDAVLVDFSVSDGEKIELDHFPLPGAPSDMLYAIRKQKKVENINDFSDPQTYDAIMGLEAVKELKPEVWGEENGINYRWVPLKGGQGYVLTWAFQKTAPNHYLLVWTTDYSPTAEAISKTAGVSVVRRVLERGFNAIQDEHKAYWNTYFSAPFLSIPDKQMEAGYWIQMYKYGSATRPGALPIDLLGPWFRATPWPRIWANLNVQLTYLPMSVGNHPEIASTLPDWIDANNGIFIRAVDDALQSDSASCGRGTSPYGPTVFWGEYGNFLWVLFDYWHFLRVYPDDERTVEKFYPMLKRADNFLIHALFKGDDGRLHISKDISPEWKEQAEDTTYNLELLRWGLETAIYIGNHFDLADSDTERYRRVLEKLVPKSVGKDGIMLGKEMPLTAAHRHYSHLVGLYPLRRINISSPEERALYLKTVNHWLGFKIDHPITRNDWCYKGYTRTGAAAMYAMLDQPEKAVAQLRTYLDTYPYPNTFYLETGPTIETPLSSAAAIQELLIQSWAVGNNSTNLVRLFPGVPSTWPEATFEALRAEGGYTVSARCVSGGAVTAFCIEADRKSVLQLWFKAGDKCPEIHTSKGSVWKLDVDGEWTILRVNLNKGERLTAGKQTRFRDPVSGIKEKSGSYHYGLND